MKGVKIGNQVIDNRSMEEVKLRRSTETLRSLPIHRFPRVLSSLLLRFRTKCLYLSAHVSPDQVEKT